MPVLPSLNAAFGIDVQLFSEDDEARLIGDLKEALSDPAIGETVVTAELRELASNMPAVGRALVTLHRRYRRALEQSAAIAARPAMTDKTEPHHRSRRSLRKCATSSMRGIIISPNWTRKPSVSRVKNHSPRQYGRHPGRTPVIAPRHPHSMGSADNGSVNSQRSFDRDTGILRLSPRLRSGQQAFQMATQLAFLEQRETIDAAVSRGSFADEESRRLARIGLANYFAER